MKPFSNDYERMIEQRFHNYCLTVLRNEACNIYKEYSRQRKKEVFLEDLPLEELLTLSITDKNVKPTIFVVGKHSIPVCDEELATALAKLEDKKRDLILLYFFLDKTDREIAALYNTIRQTITYRRKRILGQLKEYLEAEERT